MTVKQHTGKTNTKQQKKVHHETLLPAMRGLASAGLVWLFLLFLGCAKVGKPTGGPGDVNPPNYMGGVPENRSANFSGEEIDITFDEYIQLKEQNTEFLISPPLKKKPVIRVREKSIRITLNNELLPQTTYTLNFGNSISDINEGNLLPDFEFVFSTGSLIDSLSVTGKLYNAFTQKSESKENLLVMLYENLSDSAPLVEIPRYFSRANKSGLFSVNNIHPDTFRIIALKDENGNLLYDPALDEIAFLDSLLIISTENVRPQTFIKDTVRIISPAVKTSRGNKQGEALMVADTVIAPGKKLNALNVSLSYFLEESDKVFLTTRKREAPEKFTFIFSRPLFDGLQVSLLNYKPKDGWFRKEASLNNDTITYWITDTIMATQDTLRLKLDYLTTDSAGRFVTQSDTVSMRYQPTAEKATAGRHTKTEVAVQKKTNLSLAGSISNKGTQNISRPIVFIADRPLRAVIPDSIEFYKIVDSVSVKQPVTILTDSIRIRNFRLETKWEEDVQYSILLKPGTAYDIYGITNDSMQINFATQKADYYGRILLTLGGTQYPLVVQVLDQKDKVVESKRVKQSGLTIFDYLPPGKYSLKAIYDRNENGKWDTGNYLKHSQPEQIFLPVKTVELRSNWDNEVTWIISE